MNRLSTTIASIATACISLGAGSAYATIAGDTFNVETQIIGLDLVGQDLLDITVQNSGQALSGADPDVSLAQANPLTDALQLDLGVLGVEWVDDDTFDLVFGLEAQVDLGFVQLPVALNAVPLITWTLSDLNFDPTQKIVGVIQVDQDFAELLGAAVSWTHDSIQIVTNSLAATGAAINGGTGLDARVTFDIETTAIPVPPSIWMMGATSVMAGAAGYWRRRRA